jgi:hypothetical protein
MAARLTAMLTTAILEITEEKEDWPSLVILRDMKKGRFN